jgi:hypothetical protein
MKRSHILVLTLIALLCSSCNNFKTTKLPTYSIAIALEQSVLDPAVVPATSLPPDIPVMVPFAAVHGDFESGTSENSQARALKEQAVLQGILADILVFYPQESSYAGSTSQYVGLGISVSSANYRPRSTVFCYRACPAYVGIKRNEMQMITWVTEELREEAGIQEGDTLVSVNGHSVTTNTGQYTSAFDGELLRLREGDEVRLIWIRPGTGRMEGISTARRSGAFPELESMIIEVPKEHSYSRFR